MARTAAKLSNQAHARPAAAANVARLRDPMKKIITQACVDDHWAESVIACISHAASQKDLDVCDGQLTKQQHDSERKHMDEILKLSIRPLAK